METLHGHIWGGHIAEWILDGEVSSELYFLREPQFILLKPLTSCGNPDLSFNPIDGGLGYSSVLRGMFDEACIPTYLYIVDE